MGLGWKGFPGDFETLKAYTFDAASLRALKWISHNTEYVGCRDYMTLEVLKRNGIPNALMTGCPVWYDLSSIGKKVRAPKSVKKLVFTPTQGHRLLQQSIDVMALLSDRFPAAVRYCSFHHGIASDGRFLSPDQESNNKRLASAAKRQGYKVVDAAFDLKKIEFYKTCDLHVGYRVHAHLDFLSRRRPSFLIHEDGRGRGVSQALSAPGVDGFNRTWLSSMTSPLHLDRLTKLVAKADMHIQPDADAATQLRMLIDQEVDNGFARFSGVGKVIDAHFNIMKKFIAGLPK